MTQYSKGSQFERRVKKHLAEFGWWVARIAGSKGEADLVAVREGEVWFVQVKRDGRLDHGEWNDLHDLCRRHEVTPVLAWAEGKQIQLGAITGRKDGTKGKRPPLSRIEP